MARRAVPSPKNIPQTPQLNDHSELISLYPTAKPLNPNPISTPEQIIVRRQKAHEHHVRSLRKSAFRVGVYVSLPYIVGLFTIQQIVGRIPYLSNNDIGGAMFVVFSSFLFLSSTIFGGYFLWQKTTNLMNQHGLRSWPIITATVVGVIGMTPFALRIVQLIPTGFVSYAAALGVIMLVGVIAAASLVYIWTSRISYRIKLSIFALYIVIFAILFFI